MDRRRAAVDPRIAAARAAAEAPNKDKYTHEREKERFLQDLRQFHEGRGTSVPRWPYIGGKPVDLHALYTAVTQLGGWEKVSSDETWAEVQEQFGIPVSCGNADYALRQVYIRYLNAYERLHHFGLDPDSHQDGADLDDFPSSRRKTACPASGVAVTYNYQQHNLLDSTREMLGLPKESSRQNEYLRIERSLMSGLPNELDFAVNICLLLSTEGKHTLKGIKAVRIVELLLSHVGICKEAELALIWLIPESKLNFLKFWNESVNDHEVKELLCPECLLVGKVEEYQMENETEACGVDLSKVLHLGRGVGAEDHEAQRVIQLAVILRNLSLEEENLEYFASSLIIFRFVMMCVYCSSSCIRQLALDTLANIAFKIDVLFLHKMSVDPVDCGLSQLVLRTISAFLKSPDKFEVVSALEVLSRLCQVELNEDSICTQLGDAIYEHLVRLLTIHDLQLMVSALETIYQLSEIGTATSNRIADVRSSVDVLVALLTVEAHSYGPCNLPGVPATENTVEVQNPVQNQTMGPPSARPAPSVSIRPSLPLSCSTASHVLGAPNSQSPLLPGVPPSPIVALSVPSSLASQSLGPTVRSASVPLVADSEAAACSWLLAQYELSPNSSLKKMEMYRKYASVFGVYGLQNLVSPMSFANCIRVTFPSIEQESVNKDGANEVIYKGIVCRQMPAPFSSSAGDLQPGHHVFPVVSSTGAVPGLIRAGQTTTQLAPPSAFAFSKTVTFPAIQQVLQCNQGRQQNSLLVACSNSLGPSAVKPVTTAPTEANFVKTLLASKVVQNMNRIQVQLTDGQDTAAQQATVNASASGIVECSTADGLSSNTKPFTGILPTVHKDSRCKTDDAVTMGKVGRGVVNENSYIQLTRGFDVVLERLSNLEDRFSLNCCKQTCTTVQTRPLDTFTSFDRCRVANVPAVMNGEFGLTRLSGKSRNNLAEDGRTTDWLNGKEPLPALNGIVKGLENNDCFSENSYPECVQLPTEKVEIWSSANQNEPAIVHHASGSNNIATRDIVSPFPHTANVDGLSDDVLEGTLQDDDKTASGIDLSHLCHDSGHSGATVDKGRSQLPQFELDCSNSETVADNSEILLLEDFTVVQEEVLASDIPDRTCSLVAEGPDSSGPFSRCVRETESDSLVSSQEISRGISSTMQNSHSLDSVLTSHPLPIMIPASIQAKLASLQDASPSVSMICQPQLPFNATDVSIPQSSTSTIFQRPLINQNYSASFLQVVPVNDTGQQHLTPEVISSLQGSCEITADLHLTESQLVSTNVTRSTAVVMEPSAVCRLSHAAAGQSARQMIIAHPQGIQPTGVPVLQENSPSVPVTCANSSACPRLQFMTSMTSNLSNSVQIPQLHRFVAASTPGRFLIQRTQVVPQGQQPQPLRPLQQPFYQRFIVSQPGGLTQRQVLIQPSQVLMHQGVQGTGHARPVAPAGQMLPQQGPTPQPARLTAFRLAPMTNHSGNLVQHQGQQELGSQPLPVQQSQSSVQQGQPISQQDAESLGQSVDQQSQGHGQVVVPNQPVNFQQGQIGQVMTHQGQASRIFAQQGQILCHPGQQGQGQNSGPFVIQHNGGQFVLHSGSNNLPGCLMSIPVSSLQNGIGIKRLVETPKDQTVVGPSLMLSPCLTASSVACRIVTATMPLNLGLGVTTGAQSGQVGDEASASSVLSAKKRKPTVVTSQSRPAKKRKKEGEDQTACDGEVGQGRTPVQYLCEWNGCQRCFGSFNSIFQHVTKDHFESLVESSIVCKWTGCDSLKRQRWSFMTHLQERHLNEASLRAAAVRRQQQQLQGGCGSPPPESPAVPAAAAAVYPPNAALQAIRRFNARPPFPEFSDAKEGSISKHIHLTSALILRNLARYSLLGRSLIKRHEKHLALIAFSETESSSAISNCLWELHRH